jgi:type II secretory pathway predicted ATPase ExeA
VYYQYFGLQQPPFKITPDTRLFFPGGNRGVVLEALAYAITSGEGIVKVVGEVGSGKTMLCRMLETELPKNVSIVYLANPSLSPDNVLHAIAFELHIPVTAADGRLKVMHALHEFLLKKHGENRRVVMFVEEAQSMPIETLEEMRLLSNLETQHDKLLQIVLFGQPELDQNLARQEIRQLKERITYSFYLEPFKRVEIRDYINSRLRACGYKALEPFAPGAIRAMESYSRGLLRRINILADKALLAAYAANATTVTAKHVRIAAQDSEFSRRGRYRRIAAIVAGVLILGGMAAWFLVTYPPRWELFSQTSQDRQDAGDVADPPHAAEAKPSASPQGIAEEPPAPPSLSNAPEARTQKTEDPVATTPLPTGPQPIKPTPHKNKHPTSTTGMGKAVNPPDHASVESGQ